MLPRGISWNRFFVNLPHLTLEFSLTLNLLLRYGHTFGLNNSPPAIIPQLSLWKRLPMENSPITFLRFTWERDFLKNPACRKVSIKLAERCQSEVALLDTEVNQAQDLQPGQIELLYFMGTVVLLSETFSCKRTNWL